MAGGEAGIASVRNDVMHGQRIKHVHSDHEAARRDLVPRLVLCQRAGCAADDDRSEGRTGAGRDIGGTALELVQVFPLGRARAFGEDEHRGAALQAFHAAVYQCR